MAWYWWLILVSVLLFAIGLVLNIAGVTHS